MLDNNEIIALRTAIRVNELGNASPYELSYAQRGVSGASFGVFQGDTNVNHEARATLLQVLQASGVTEETCTSVLGLVSRPCPNGSPLTGPVTKQVNAALSADQGKPLVDAMDGKLLGIVQGEIESSIAAAARAQLVIHPVARIYIGLWVNMTGTPDALNRWLSGSPEMGVTPPSGPTVSAQNIENYLNASLYFRLHPRNFVHMQTAVEAGAALLT